MVGFKKLIINISIRASTFSTLFLLSCWCWIILVGWYGDFRLSSSWPVAVVNYLSVVVYTAFDQESAPLPKRKMHTIFWFNWRCTGLVGGCNSPISMELVYFMSDVWCTQVDLSSLDHMDTSHDMVVPEILNTLSISRYIFEVLLKPSNGTQNSRRVDSRPTAQPPGRANTQAMKTHTALQSLALWPREALLHEVGKKGKVQTRAWHRCILSSVDEWTCVFSGWLTSDTHRCAYTTNRMCVQRWFHTSRAAQTCNWTATSKE